MESRECWGVVGVGCVEEVALKEIGNAFGGDSRGDTNSRGFPERMLCVEVSGAKDFSIRVCVDYVVDVLKSQANLIFVIRGFRVYVYVAKYVLVRLKCE